MKDFFKKPVQLFFVNKKGEPCPGVGYQDKVICFCCGRTLSIEKIKENAKKFNYSKALFCYPSWEAANEGSVLPDGIMIMEGLTEYPIFTIDPKIVKR